MSESVAFTDGLGIGITIVSMNVNSMFYFWVGMFILILAGIGNYFEHRKNYRRHRGDRT